MIQGGRNAIRDSLLRHARSITTKPTQDVWGLTDLWEVKDTHFRRPGESLGAAFLRWGALFLDNAIEAFFAYLKAFSLLAIPVMALTFFFRH